MFFLKYMCLIIKIIKLIKMEAPNASDIKVLIRSNFIFFYQGRRCYALIYSIEASKKFLHRLIIDNWFLALRLICLSKLGLIIVFLKVCKKYLCSIF